MGIYPTRIHIKYYDYSITIYTQDNGLLRHYAIVCRGASRYLVHELIRSLSACRVCVYVIEDVSVSPMVDWKCLWRGYQLVATLIFDDEGDENIFTSI